MGKKMEKSLEVWENLTDLRRVQILSFSCLMVAVLALIAFWPDAPDWKIAQLFWHLLTYAALLYGVWFSFFLVFSLAYSGPESDLKNINFFQQTIGRTLPTLIPFLTLFLGLALMYGRGG